MSEYLIKKAVLEHIRKEIDIIYRQKVGVSKHRQIFSRGAIRGLENLEHAIQSSRFDAPEQQAEIDRLRAAAIKLHETINSFWQGDCDKADVVAAQSNLCDALSTTTEPTKSDQDKTCVMCGSREGKYLSTANRWFCEPCTDALPSVNDIANGSEAIIAEIKDLLEIWDFRAIAAELESGYDRGVLVELVELCEKLTGAKSPSNPNC